MPKNPFILNVSEVTPIPNTKGGQAQVANRGDFPALVGMAMALLNFELNGLRQPHWHPNAHELDYIISGKVVFGIASPDGSVSTFVAKPGDVVFIPKGYFHYIKCVLEPAKIVLWFSNVDDTTIELAGALRGASNQILAQAFQVDVKAVQGLSTDLAFFLEGNAHDLSSFPISESSEFLFDLAASQPVDRKNGLFQRATKENFAILETLSISRIKLDPGVLRQLHWHPNADELDFVLTGEAEFGIITPQGDTFVSNVVPGDMIMIPQAYFHYFKNVGDGPFELILGFDDVDDTTLEITNAFNLMPDFIKSEALRVEASRFKGYSRSTAPFVPVC